jgi:uncharacterized protein (TIGR00304 family)
MRPDKIFIGFALLFMGIAMLTVSASVEYGGVILIGPIPIVFGSSPEMAIAGIAVTAVMLLIIYSAFRW